MSFNVYGCGITTSLFLYMVDERAKKLLHIDNRLRVEDAIRSKSRDFCSIPAEAEVKYYLEIGNGKFTRFYSRSSFGTFKKDYDAHMRTKDCQLQFEE